VTSTVVEVGAQLTDKVSADFFQKHQDTENWTWKTDGAPVTYEFERLRKGASGSPVALLLSLSERIDPKDLAAGLKETAALYELRLVGRAASRAFLRTRADLDNFRIAYIAALSRIAADHGIGEPIHLIPAIPAPVAVICGRARHPKAHGPLLVYDLDRDKGGYIFRKEIKT
jgi:hypothetical protein